jgi:hypothetical protein
MVCEIFYWSLFHAFVAGYESLFPVGHQLLGSFRCFGFFHFIGSLLLFGDPPLSFFGALPGYGILSGFEFFSVSQVGQNLLEAAFRYSEFYDLAHDFFSSFPEFCEFFKPGCVAVSDDPLPAVLVDGVWCVRKVFIIDSRDYDPLG